MLLNIFFENMNGTLELLLIGLFFFALYWFIMRKYNSLGLRMLILCICMFGACTAWLYKDEMNLRKMIREGEQYIATVNSKSVSQDGKDNIVDVSFTSKDGKAITATTDEYVSKEEWAKFETGKPLSVIYIPSTKQTYVQLSIMRFKEDKIWLYGFAGFWLLLGLMLYFWLRRYKVGVDKSGNEWVERPDGTVMLDERKSKAARLAKRGNILSKMVQTFGK